MAMRTRERWTDRALLPGLTKPTWQTMSLNELIDLGVNPVSWVWDKGQRWTNSSEMEPLCPPPPFLFLNPIRFLFSSHFVFWSHWLVCLSVRWLAGWLRKNRFLLIFFLPEMCLTLTDSVKFCRRYGYYFLDCQQDNKNLRKDFYEIFTRGVSWPNLNSIVFWWWSGLWSRSTIFLNNCIITPNPFPLSRR